jgi:hypothetical protein
MSMPYLLPAFARKHSFITIMICLLAKWGFSL